MPDSATVAAILTVRKEAEEKFRVFERLADAVMKMHGGRIERTIVVALNGWLDAFKEVHVDTFPNAQALAAYQNDERLHRTPLRDESAIDSQILVCEDGPNYGAS